MTRDAALLILGSFIGLPVCSLLICRPRLVESIARRLFGIDLSPPPR